MCLDPMHPTQCWTAPLIPQAIYNSGFTLVPVWPTWSLCGRQPSLVATREHPTAPPTSPANSSNGANPSALPIPRPPETTTRAVERLTPPLRAVRSTSLLCRIPSSLGSKSSTVTLPAVCPDGCASTAPDVNEIIGVPDSRRDSSCTSPPA